MVRDGHAVLEADGTAYHNRGWWFPQALMPDLSVRRTRDWWTEKRRYLVEDFDVDGFKTDGGEHAWGHDLRYADGRRGDEGNNLFPIHYARAFGDLLRSAGKAPVTFSRAGFTGSQAHGIFWAGDEQTARTIATDRPLLRPRFFDHADDTEIWNHPYQHILGDDLLVNPVLEPAATTWTTYLPEGTWYDAPGPASPCPVAW